MGKANCSLVIVRLAATAAKSLQLSPTLCDPIDSSPPGSPVPGILQARTLEWVAISFSNAWKWKLKVKSLSHVRPSATPWTAAFQAPLSMRFFRQEHWSGVPLPSPYHSLVTLIHSLSTATPLILSYPLEPIVYESDYHSTMPHHTHIIIFNLSFDSISHQ